MAIGSFLTAKCIQKTSVFSSYNSSNTIFIFLRSFVSCLSKCCQYGAVALIPLALSSTIQFTTGPVIGAIMAFILIKEKLS